MSHNHNNNFYRIFPKFSDSKTLKNCENFLANKISTPSLKIPKLIEKKKNNSVIIKNKINFNFSQKEDVKLKKVNLSCINDTNNISNISKIFSKINSFKNNELINAFKPEYNTNKIKIKNKRNKMPILNYNENKKENNIIKTFEFLPKDTTSKIHLGKIDSARNIKNDKNFDNNLINSKVNKIIKDLLSKDTSNYKVKEYHSRNLYPLSNSINPMKYIEFNMKKDPHNSKLFKSYQKQIKFLIDEKVRRFLIEGINDYRENLQKYREIYPVNFTWKTKNEDLFKQKNIKNSILKGKNNFNKNNSYYNSFEIPYNKEKEKFRNNFIKAYYSKDTNKNQSNNYIKNNMYFKYVNNNDFKKMITLDDKIKMISSTTNNLNKYISNDYLTKFRKKYLL